LDASADDNWDGLAGTMGVEWHDLEAWLGAPGEEMPAARSADRPRLDAQPSAVGKRRRRARILQRTKQASKGTAQGTIADSVQWMTGPGSLRRENS
jgi:hypothetical protein